ncbi:hypothetical protein D3C77_541930 [compost metagenome]
MARIVRPAFGHDEHLRKGLERPDNTGNEIKKDDRRQHRKSYAKKGLFRAGPINRGRLVKFGRDSLHSGEQQDDTAAYAP